MASSKQLAKLQKEMRKQKKQFGTMETRFERLNKASDLSDSESESGSSHFQFGMASSSQSQGVLFGQNPNDHKPVDNQGFIFFQRLDE